MTDDLIIRDDESVDVEARRDRTTDLLLRAFKLYLEDRRRAGAIPASPEPDAPKPDSPGSGFRRETPTEAEVEVGACDPAKSLTASVDDP